MAEMLSKHHIDDEEVIEFSTGPKSKFPLYDLLNEKKNSLTKAPNWQTFIPTIMNASADHRTMIFVLIYHHWQITKTKVVTKESELPYGIETVTGGANGSGIKILLFSLPMDLQLIIQAYIESTSC
jgi:hypothetical protein